MEKRMLWLGIALMVISLCSSGAIAATMGPPAAGLDAGQFRIGLDISSAETGIDGKGTGTEIEMYEYYVDDVLQEGDSWEWDDEYKWEFKDKIQSEMLFANLGYGITDKLEVYLRLGMSDLGFEDEWSDAFFGSSDEIAYGFGVKATIWEDTKVKLGALFQMSWYDFDGEFEEFNGVYSEIEGENVGVPVQGDWEVDYYQMKIAVGPVYELTEAISVYGGPFVQFLDGDMEQESNAKEKNECEEFGVCEEEIYEYHEKESTDIKERLNYGVYVGAQINCGENLPICIECQTNVDTYVVGASLAYKF